MRTIATGLSVAAVVAAAVAAGQTMQPGQMTQARVWIQNRGESEAIPMRIEAAARDLAPLPVLVLNGDPTRTGTSSPMAVRVVRPMWEYRTVSIGRDADAALLLAPLGAAGWEVTGVAFPSADGTTLLLKRVR